MEKYLKFAQIWHELAAIWCRFGTVLGRINGENRAFPEFAEAGNIFILQQIVDFSKSEESLC